MLHVAIIKIIITDHYHNPTNKLKNMLATLLLRNVADELRIFESINHDHLINHFGVEIHREEMLIFMEYCPEVNFIELMDSAS